MTATPSQQAPRRQAPLAGIRVVDMSTVVFGPYCTQILADLGADVIKIEPEEGDTARNIGVPACTAKMGPVHLRLNRGKRSVSWDLRSDHGRTAVRRLMATADVFIHNVRPDAIARIGLDHDAVRALKPDIVYVHCTGFGLDGPYAGLQAYDDIIQAASGATSLLPRVDGNPNPRYLPMLFADKVSGLHAVYATLAAVLARQRDGQGQHVEVPMFEVVSSFNLLEHLCDQTFDPPTGDWGYQRQLDPVRQPMRTRDGHIAIAPYLDDRWQRFFHAAGHPEVLDEPRFATPELRRANMSQMYQVAAALLPEKTTAEWLRLLKNAHVPAMHVNAIGEVLADPHLAAVGLFERREHPTEGAYHEVRPPVRFSGFDYGTPRHAPGVGQHTAEIDRELGLGD